MALYQVHDKAIVLVLNSREAQALKERLAQHTGIKKTKPLIRVEEKLAWAMGEG